MSLKETINNDIKQAMLAKKKAELTALRGIKSMILLAETEKGAAGELSSDAEMKLLMKALKPQHLYNLTRSLWKTLSCVRLLHKNVIVLKEHQKGRITNKV